MGYIGVITHLLTFTNFLGHPSRKFSSTVHWGCGTPSKNDRTPWLINRGDPKHVTILGVREFQLAGVFPPKKLPSFSKMEKMKGIAVIPKLREKCHL